uniref:Uncharacterized protein n=1 Tax=Oryza rufipogon TaxID=4529 RepID=A0A0E0MRY0_ORYRU
MGLFAAAWARQGRARAAAGVAAGSPTSAAAEIDLLLLTICRSSVIVTQNSARYSGPDEQLQ